MPARPGRTASMPNPKLEHCGVLIGDWTTVGTHPLFPDTTFRGRSSFEWIEGGAFLMMRSELDDERFPTGMAIIGTDDSAGECYMLYFDSRGVSRKYAFALSDDTLTWWRDAQDFSQRFIARIAADGRAIVGRGEMCRDGTTWEGDLALTYTRIE